eukprot:GHUV01037088.1.p1 GENE.GHUV01037088.1~~GHUV01037088.1.p1  ORF type:complete len:108 (-),score=21.78 GHUV01037088.1:48-371(-)
MTKYPRYIRKFPDVVSHSVGLSASSTTCFTHSTYAELTTQQTHQLFQEFVAAWNGGKLPLRFYQGLTAAPLKRTSYSWQFKNKPSAGPAAGAAKLGMAAFLDDQQEQ